MADTENRTGERERRKMVKEAFMLLVTNDDIRDITLDALDMATSKEEKPEIRLKAKEFIFKYLMPLPKQEVDMNGDMNLKILREIINEPTSEVS